MDRESNVWVFGCLGGQLNVEVEGEGMGWVGSWGEVVEEWGESGWQGDVTPYRGKDTPLLQFFPHYGIWCV